jgi:hypothetical protein
LIRTWHEALIDLYETRFLRRHGGALDGLDSQLTPTGMPDETTARQVALRHLTVLRGTTQRSRQLGLGTASNVMLTVKTESSMSKLGSKTRLTVYRRRQLTSLRAFVLRGIDNHRLNGPAFSSLWL